MTQTEKQPLRKQGRQRGTRTQTPTAFRLDNDLIEWLNSQPNKGRYINNLIRADMERGGR